MGDLVFVALARFACDLLIVLDCFLGSLIVLLCAFVFCRFSLVLSDFGCLWFVFWLLLL